MASNVLITGASTGFGRDTAERLARRGHQVFATMRDVSGRNAKHRESLEQLASAERLQLRVLELDVTDEESVQRAVSSALEEAGHLDVVINNAGVATLGVSEAYTTEQFQRLFDVNVFGVQRVNRAVLPSMRQRRNGLLIHISSGAGRCAVPGMAAYCASKYALEAIADAYRFELLRSASTRSSWSRVSIGRRSSIASSSPRMRSVSRAMAMPRSTSSVFVASSSIRSPRPRTPAPPKSLTRS